MTQEDPTAEKVADPVTPELPDGDYAIVEVFGHTTLVGRVAPAMTMEEAMEINERLVRTYFIQNGITEGDVPSLADITLQQAVAASRMVSTHPGDRNANGTTTHHCFVEPARVHRVLAFGIMHNPSPTSESAQ